MKPLTSAYEQTKSALTMRVILAASAVLALAAIGATVFGNIFLALPLGVPAYLVLPGFLSQLAFRKKMSIDLDALLYSIGISLVMWILGGLAIDLLLPMIGIMRPLQPVYELTFYTAFIAAMIAVALRNHWRSELSVGQATSTVSTKVAIAASILLPVLSAFGATTLNNGGPSYITYAMLAGLCALVVFIAASIQRVDRRVYPIAIYSLALSLLLMYSLRSWYVLGWDVNNELRVFLTTARHARWLPTYFPGNAYNACLSITILPTILSKLLHVSPQYTFKFVYQLLFAAVPVAVYSLARRYLLPVLAFLAAALFAAQTWFFEQMPALARQEIGIVMFVLLLMALFDANASKLRRYTLAYIFLIGMVLSHYSTAYVWLIVAAGAYLISLVWRLFSKTTRSRIKLLPLHIVIVSALFIGIWEGPVTHTLNHATNVAAGSIGQIGEIFSPSVLEQGFKAAFLAPPNNNTEQDVLSAARAAQSERPGPASDYYSPKVIASYAPKAITPSYKAPQDLPPTADSILSKVLAILRALVTNVFSLAGIFLIWLTLLRRNKSLPSDFIALCVVSYGLIVGMLFLPYLQENYNITRLYIQLFALLVIPTVAALWILVRRNVKVGLPVLGLVVALLLASMTGFIDQFTGGQLRITMAGPRGDMDAYYVNTDEVYAAQWLAKNREPGLPVYADSIANLRLSAYGDFQATTTNLFPGAIARNGYVYLINVNNVQGLSIWDMNNVSLSFNTPTTFLNRNKNLIYSSGSSDIYK